MVPWWTLPLAVIGGAVFGIMLVAVLTANGSDE